MTKSKKILITGAGSGLGEGAAIGLARNGHDVIAAAQTWPQVTALRGKARELGLSSLRVEKLDLFDPYEGIEKTFARAAIVVFPSAQAGRDWFASPTYRKIAPIRQKSAHARLFRRRTSRFRLITKGEL